MWALTRRWTSNTSEYGGLGAAVDWCGGCPSARARSCAFCFVVGVRSGYEVSYSFEEEPVSPEVEECFNQDHCGQGAEKCG